MGPNFAIKYHKRWFGGIFDTTDILWLGFEYTGNTETDQVSFTFEVAASEIFLVIHTQLQELDGKRIKRFDVLES